MNSKLKLLRFWLFFVLTILLKLNVTAQEALRVSSPDVNIIPPPPTEAALGKYGAIPVSKYTGVPNISIPLYELKEGSLTLPISLSYHASGIRVEEMASWVGLGWSLNAGGVITRTVVGLPDEHNYGYFEYGNELPDPNSPASSFVPEEDKLWSACNSDADYEPDVYTFNFMGFTGTFYIDPYTKKCHIVPQANITIKYNYSQEIKTFTATDYNGIVYEFAESNLIESKPSQSVNNDYYTISPSISYTSTWYLTKVWDQNTTDTINFQYAKNIEEYDLRLSSVKGEIICPDDNSQPDVKINSTNQITATGYVISRILAKNLSIDFYTSSRQDMKSASGSKLDFIIIHNYPRQTFKKKINFNYGYSGNGDYLSKRLCLEDINIQTIDDLEIYSYSFLYYDGLPPRDSYQQDFWGFYNGVAQNDSYDYPVPRAYFNGKNYSGAILTSDASGEYMRAGTLRKITYPTKGTTEFEYEPNTYSAFYNGSELKNVNEEESTSSGGVSNNNILNKKIERLIYTSDDPDKFIEFDLYKDMDVTFSLDKLDSVRLLVNRVDNSTSFTVCNSTKEEIKWMSEGKYRLSVTEKYSSGSVLDKYSGDASVAYEVDVSGGGGSGGEVEYNAVCGGLRIDKITDFDQNGDIVNERSYSYKLASNTELSSGIRISPIPKYTYYSHIPISSQDIIIGWGTVFNRTNVNQVNQILTKGSPVGYREVKEIYVDGSYTWSKFSVPNDVAYGGYNILGDLSAENCEIGPTVHPFLTVPSDDKDYLRGRLLEEKSYDKDKNIVKSISYSYKSNTLYKIPGMRVGFIIPTEDPVGSQKMGYKFYVKSLCSNVLASKTETLYLKNGLENTTITSYTYNSDFQIKSVSKYNSPVLEHNTPVFLDDPIHIPVNDQLTNKYYYARDKDDIPSELFNEDVVNDMINKKMIGIPLLSTTYKNGKIIQGKANKFDYFGNNSLIQPRYYYEYNTENLSYEKKIEFDYNNLGKLIEQKSNNGIVTSYYWGYYGHYPVAKLDNISYSEISTELSKELSNLSEFNTMTDALYNSISVLLPPKGMMTTYTYSPGVGITSQTDPNGVSTYYEYDGMGRLIEIKDNDNNSVSQYGYHYSSEPVSDDFFSQKTVTFNSQQGTAVQSVEVIGYEKIPRPNPPTKEGHIFDGWYSDVACTQAWDFENGIIENDITLYAKWEAIEYIIRVNTIGSGSLSPGAGRNVTVDYGNDITLTINPEVGYHIKNVVVNGDSLGAINKHTFSNVKSDQSISVEFEINTYGILVFNHENGKIEANTYRVTHGGKVTCYFTPNSGYHLEKVFVNEIEWPFFMSGNELTIRNITENLRVKAIFAVNYCHINATATDGGSMSPSGDVIVGYKKDTTFTFTPDVGHYVSDVIVNGESLGARDSYNFSAVKEDQTISVEFKPHIYTVEFMYKDDKFSSAEVIYNSLITEPRIPLEIGYEISWIPRWDFSTDRVTSDTVLYALKTLRRYTITFNSQGGSSVSNKTAFFNSKITAPSAPTRARYNFGGWYKDSDCTIAWNFSSDQVKGDMTLYAKWIAITYKVDFVYEFETIKSTQVTYNSLLVEPRIPLQLGEEITWSAGHMNVWDFSTDRVTSDLTLTAFKRLKRCTITFNSQGGSSVSGKTTTYNNTITAPSAPTRTGYTFGGWYKDSGCTNVWNFSTDKVTRDITLYAKWIIKTYTITVTTTGSGAMSPSGNTTINYGGNKTYTFTPSLGYHISDVKVNGVSKGALSTYTFSNIKTNQTLSVVFAKDLRIRVPLDPFVPKVDPLK